MAMYTILRRATAAVAPLAARRAAVSSSSRTFHSAISVKLLLHKETTPFVRSRSFSNAVAKKTVEDDNLVQVLQTEIEDHAEQVEISEEFPFEIEVIEDNLEKRTIQLKRQYEDEIITGKVVIHNVGPRLTSLEGKYWSIFVTVFKGNGMCLEFDVTSYPDKVEIHSLSIKKPGELEDKLVIKGPKFRDLDENLQKAFLKYLEIRGITPGTSKFLQEYAIKKDNEDELVWLQNLKSVVEK